MYKKQQYADYKTHYDMQHAMQRSCAETHGLRLHVFDMLNLLHG